MGEHPWNPNIVDDLALPPHAFPFQILKDWVKAEEAIHTSLICEIRPHSSKDWLRSRISLSFDLFPSSSRMLPCVLFLWSSWSFQQEVLSSTRDYYQIPKSSFQSLKADVSSFLLSYLMPSPFPSWDNLVSLNLLSAS
jgi:hypothetical protein